MSPLDEMDEASSAAGDKFSVILPTYNERENLPVVVWLIVEHLEGVVEYEIIIVGEVTQEKSIMFSRIALPSR